MNLKCRRNKLEKIIIGILIGDQFINTFNVIQLE